MDFIDAGVLRQGDILLLDNAKIHKAAETIRLLGLLLDSARVRMWFLPRYSPEVSSVLQFFFGVLERVTVCACASLILASWCLGELSATCVTNGATAAFCGRCWRDSAVFHSLILLGSTSSVSRSLFVMCEAATK